jgi:dienelactone hydrolase
MKRYASTQVLLLLLVSMLVMSHALLWAEQAQRIYSIKMMGKSVGQETLAVQPTPDGQGIHATAQLTITMPIAISEKQDLLLTTDYQLKQYTSEGTAAGTTMQMSAVVEGNIVVMKAQAGQTPMEEQRIPWQRGMVIGEGFAFDAEFLLRQYDRRVGGDQQFQALMPSMLMSTPVTVRLAGLGSAILNGSPVETEQFVAEAMGMEMKIWAVRETGVVLKVINPNGQMETVLRGASFPDVAESPAAPVAAPAAPQEFPEKAVTFRSGKYNLYGTLTLPSSTNRPIHGVVLLHGSGPNDRDETIGGNKPFRDLAHGLADRGIAVLRYDKLTYTYRTKFTRREIINLTLREEVLDDALNAIGFLRKQPGINSRGVFLVGHSLGAWCAPFIAAQDNQLAGVIMLAPHATDFDHAFIRQIQYRAQVMGASSEQIDQLLSEVRNGFARLREKTFPSDHFLLGASGKYWYDYLSRKPLEVATGLPQPILVLQGEKDYQTSMDDFAAWKKALGDSRKTNVQFRIFPQLNHLFMPVDGPSTGQEYAIPGTVAPQVIETIAQFCLQTPARTR